MHTGLCMAWLACQQPSALAKICVLERNGRRHTVGRRPGQQPAQQSPAFRVGQSDPCTGSRLSGCERIVANAKLRTHSIRSKSRTAAACSHRAGLCGRAPPRTRRPCTRPPRPHACPSPPAATASPPRPWRRAGRRCRALPWPAPPARAEAPTHRAHTQNCTLNCSLKAACWSHVSPAQQHVLAAAGRPATPR